MKAEILNNKMKAFETAMHQYIAPDLYIIARLKPQGVGLDIFPIQEWLAETTEHLMTCGFHTTYAYTTRREISVLFDIGENSFNRRYDMLISTITAEASANLSLLAKHPVIFDCRIAALPNKQSVIDYFNWRISQTENTTYDTCSYWEVNDNGKRELVTVGFKDLSNILASKDPN